MSNLYIGVLIKGSVFGYKSKMVSMKNSCEHKVDDGDKFCRECGQKLILYETHHYLESNILGFDANSYKFMENEYEYMQNAKGSFATEYFIVVASIEDESNTADYIKALKTSKLIEEKIKKDGYDASSKITKYVNWRERE